MAAFTTSQLAAHYGKSERTIRRWITQKKIEAHARADGLYDVEGLGEAETIEGMLRRVLAGLEDIQARLDRLEAQPAPRRAQPTTPRIAATTTPRQVAGNIPAGLVAWRIFSVEHHIPESTTRRAIDRGDIPMIEGSWLVGNATIKGCLDGTGKAAFYRVMSGRPQFARCEDCPHS